MDSETTQRSNGGTSSSPLILLPSLSDVLACQFSVWYPHFSALSDRYQGRRNVTIKSVVVSPVPSDFVDYLNSDRLILPHGARTSSALLEAASQRRRNDPNFPEVWSSDDEDETDEHITANTHRVPQVDDTSDGEVPQPNLHEPLNESSDDDDGSDEVSFAFPDLNRQIDTIIRNQLGGACLPKFNWSAPKDAVWVNQGTMECRFAGDVYLLLKASDFCAHDLHHATYDVVADGGIVDHSAVALSQPQDPTESRSLMERRECASSNEAASGTSALSFQLQVVLRKWCTLYPSQEFRCFVRDRHLLAISQRHHSQHFAHLLDQTDVFRRLIEDFFTSVVNVVLSPSTATIPFELQNLSSYVFDVYIDKKQRVWLIDINVWASRTDPLLFEWCELVDIPTQQSIEMRLVETDKQVRVDPLSCYRAPIDTVHVVAGIGDSSSAEGGGLASTKFFTEFMSQCKRP